MKIYMFLHVVRGIAIRGYYAVSEIRGVFITMNTLKQDVTDEGPWYPFDRTAVYQ